MNKRQIFPLLAVSVLLIIYYYSSSNSAEPLCIITMSSTRAYKVIAMDDHRPFYRLATFDGRKPYADGDRAQATVVEHLQLVESCRRDPSLLVVDVGAYLGDFGLYAAACGCRVYLFEVQPDMADIIRASIAVNNFSSSRIQLLRKAVSDLPANSTITFSIAGGSTTAANGTLQASTIRLDEVPWPPNSTILLLKIDVEGFELSALRSASKLFRDNRIQHVIFEYSAYWTARAAQKDLLPFVENTLGAKRLYALHRTGSDVYGPLTREMLDHFHENHFKKHLQTDIYATFVDSTLSKAIKAKYYDPTISFA